MAKIYPAGVTPLIVTRKDYTPESGEVFTYEHTGDEESVELDYQDYKSTLSSGAGGNLASLSVISDRGRNTLIRRYIRENKDIEELYGVDVIKDILTAPYFDELSDTEVVAVRTAYNAGDAASADWTAKQKNLYMHLARGEESYLLTQFILRVSKHSVISSAVGASFVNINKVVAAPALSLNMALLVASLPDGEWLKKPPVVENIGGGRWRVEQAYHWAEKWSVIYGGTWGVA